MQRTPPRADEIEVSVFGPGFGESIVIHLGKGEWIIVDSCVDVPKGDPKPLAYLSLLELDPSRCVRAVIASHWHDDHVAGLSKTLDACSSAIFYCPISLSKNDFLDLAELYREDIGDFPPGPKEIRNAIEIAACRSKTLGRQMLHFATSDRVIWESSSVSIIALSPSDEMTRRALTFMAREYAIATSGKRKFDRLTPNTPNDTATALRIDVAGRSVLLGSDLESGNNPLIGWPAVLNSPVGIGKKSSMFKVAHHGSKTGHHNDVWLKMLDPEPWALISPFRWGRHRIPNATDRERILSATKKAYITSHPDRDRAPIDERPKKIKTLIDQTAKNRRTACGPIGHIRWRASLSDLSDNGRVELYDGAIKLV